MASASTTGTLVRNTVNTVFSDSGVPQDDPSWVLLLNLAIAASWPYFRITEYAAGGTLASGTFLYSMASLTPAVERELGIAQVFIQEVDTATAPDVSHKVEQYFDASADAWYLKFSPEVTRAYDTKSFNVTYQHRHADITAVGNTIYLPLDYLTEYMVATLARKLYLNPATTQGTSRYGDVMANSERTIRERILPQQRGEKLSSLALVRR